MNGLSVEIENFMKFIDDPDIAFLAKKGDLDRIEAILERDYDLKGTDIIRTAIEVTERYSGSKSMFVLPSLHSEIAILHDYNNKNIQFIQNMMQ